MPTQSESTSISLRNNITINGTTYRKGSNVEVPRKVAEDLLRMDHDYTEYEVNLHKKRTSETNLGSMAVGDGAA